MTNEVVVSGTYVTECPLRLMNSRPESNVISLPKSKGTTNICMDSLRRIYTEMFNEDAIGDTSRDSF